MDPVIKHMWVDALRSGKYEQGTFFLRRKNRYCCLGVLCDLAIKTSGIGEWDEESEGWTDHQNKMAKTGVLPSRVMTWAGLQNHGENVCLDNDRWLSSLNDGGYTFERIADIIEREL